MSKIKITVKRGDSLQNRYEVYEVPLQEKMSVFNALEYIICYLDPSLAFYTSCKIGKCLGCTMMVDGKRRLACTTIVEGDLTLDPDSRYPVVRDLVVDMSGSEE
jgi:succinate dehydrogenase/fumarate reductase-like Fe-S protein